ncbi:protein kinase [candidate division KSB1 bacterium]|nr:protein kinase [candidate division KSB1 bacterium]
MSESVAHADPQVVELLKALGRAYLENGENRKAIEKFRHLVQEGHEDAEITRDYALALARTEAVAEDALAAYGKALELDPDNKSLCLTLATVFLKAEVKTDPALKVYRRALDFSPPFQEEIKIALEKIFEETTGTVSIPETRQTLLDCVDNPQLLSLFLNAVWHDQKFDDALDILEELHSRSSKDAIYLKGICETLLMKKASAEQIGQQFTLSQRQANHCLQYANLSTPLEHIAEIETYLDYKNLFLCLEQGKTAGSDPPQDEYEFFLLNNRIQDFQAETEHVTVEIEPGFGLARDLIHVIGEGPVAPTTAEPSGFAIAPDSPNTWLQSASMAVFHITNYDASPEASKLPFETFVRLVSRDLAALPEHTVLHCSDGMVVLSTDVQGLFKAAVDTLNKLARYNQVVEEAELIGLCIALHCSPIPFMQLENEGISELRKTFKVCNLKLVEKRAESPNDPADSVLLVTDEVATHLSGVRIRPLGEHALGFFPHKHAIYAWQDEHSERRTATSRKKYFGKYEVLEALKENAASSTFKAYDAQLERTVILKAFNSDVFARIKTASAIRKQFFEEIRKLNRISHPGLNVIYDAGEDERFLFLVREVIEGQSLKDFLAGQTDMPVKSILELYIQVCKVLRHCHERHVWHKNLKPSNIFVVQQKDIKVLDAGILQLGYADGVWDDDVTATLYAAPEQLTGAPLTQTCDIFQLGTMLYESLAGRHPFLAETPGKIRTRIIADDPAPQLQIDPPSARALSALLMKALHKDPEKRHQSLPDLEFDLKRSLKNLQTTTYKKDRFLELEHPSYGTG